MEYFKFLNKNSLVDIIAPSMSCGRQKTKINRLNSAINHFNKKGLKVKVEENCYTDNKNARSNTAKLRAEEFEKVFLDNNTDAIISVAGGEFELEILPYINFEEIKKAENKIFQGMSDNTCLGFALTTICDKASVYASNFTEFGMGNWHGSIKDNFSFLCGEQKTQVSFKKMEIENNRRVEGMELASYNLTKATHPIILTGEKEVNIKGRIIGGCLDILSHICGTKFDNVKNYIKKYKDDGIIWFFESCDLNVLEQSRCIWKLKNAGWFEGAKGFLIGRPLNTESVYDCDYKNCNLENLKDFNVPVIIDLDIGHTSPTWFIVNGAIANFEMKNNIAKINFELQ